MLLSVRKRTDRPAKRPTPLTTARVTVHEKTVKDMQIDQNVINRFLAHVRVNSASDCWEWTGYVMPNGYGSFKYLRKGIYAHRMSYLIHKGDIPEGMFVCHACDNRACVNPDHIWVGTGKDNANDRDSKNRHWVQCGVKSWNARFTEGDVRNIRKQANEGGRGIQTRLAREYGAAKSTIRDIITGHTWAHVK